jgi:hypothetical protein
MHSERAYPVRSQQPITESPIRSGLVGTSLLRWAFAGINQRPDA